MKNRKSLITVVVVIFVLVIINMFMSLYAICSVYKYKEKAIKESNSVTRYVDDEIYICPECGKGLIEDTSYYITSMGQLRCGNCHWQGREFESENGNQAAADHCLDMAKQSYLDNYGTPVEVLKRFMDKE